jgi:DNA-binding HxlR family transcriptional regulator
MEINLKNSSQNKMDLVEKMGGANVLAAECPSREILRHITGRWGLLIFRALQDGEKHRFSDLRRAISGISEKMLAQTLQQLEYDGFVERTVHPVVPPHVEYQLTSLGIEFSTRVDGLISWLENNLFKIMHSREKVESRQD